jgi:hypothetical protein
VGIPWIREQLKAIPEGHKHHRNARNTLLLLQGLDLICRLSYIYGRSDSYSLLMLLARIKYARNGLQADSLMPLESWLGTGVFGLRFFEWWRTGSGLSAGVSDPPAALYSPPSPPDPPKRAEVPFNHCPKCKDGVKEPMATSSGIVYCATCIRGEGHCLVTGEALGKDSLTALYLE